MKNSYKRFIGLDPSLAHFGIVIIDTKSKQIILDDIGQPKGNDFMFTAWSIANLYNEFKDKYEKLIDEETLIAQEAPIQVGLMAAHLFSLGVYFYLNLGSYSDFKNIKTYHVMKLRKFHKKKYDKKDTIEVVDNILKIFEEDGYKIYVVKSRTKKTLSITDGEADAFMYAIANYVLNIKNKLSKKVLALYPNLELITSIEEDKYADK